MIYFYLSDLFDLVELRDFMRPSDTDFISVLVGQFFEERVISASVLRNKNSC